MDNLTHTLFGLTLARTPLGRSGRGVTMALVLASSDTLEVMSRLWLFVSFRVFLMSWLELVVTDMSNLVPEVNMNDADAAVAACSLMVNFCVIGWLPGAAGL